MRRLYLQIFLGFVAMLILGGAVGSWAWRELRDSSARPPLHSGLARIAQRVLPQADAPREAMQTALEDLAGPLFSRVTLRGADGKLLAAVGEPLPVPRGERHAGGLLAIPDGLPAAIIELPDKRLLLAQGLRRGPSRGALGALGATLLVLAVGAYLISRRITRRLEQLQGSVEALGKGDLGARVEVRGHDEVAKLAASFNAAASRIENLVRAQRDTLAAASHELRSPLARLAMAIELLQRAPREDVAERARRDIAELDELIDELLTASRMDADSRNAPAAEVELLALAAEEAARVGARVGGDPCNIHGDARLLRRLLRNLLENARRYARDSQIDVDIEPLPGGACVRVQDQGPGVPPAERERIFEPFYRPAGSAETGKGSGLGLALVRRIARHHGGEARYVERDGGGACIEVELHGVGGA